jgi:hypothetical protein
MSHMPRITILSMVKTFRNCAPIASESVISNSSRRNFRVIWLQAFSHRAILL